MSTRALQDVVVCAHHGCTFVERWLPELSDAERKAFRAVDPRAFRADSERRLRAVVAIADELPLTIATVGLPAVYALFDDVDAFGAVVRGRVPMAVQFAQCLVPLAGDMARIEGALARARRPRAPMAGRVGRGPGVEVTEVQDGALDHARLGREALGPDPVTAVCGGRRLSPLPHAPQRVWVLVSHGPTGGELATCSAALGRLLDGCTEDGETEATFVARARTLGCDSDDEARELLGDLLGDGLLQRP
jgi:hypothetical protein